MSEGKSGEGSSVAMGSATRAFYGTRKRVPFRDGDGLVLR
jgi:hypothetical protein